MHISEFVFKKKKIFFFIIIALIVGGVLSYQKLGKLEDPEITIMIANVVTVYPGASAHEIELQVTNVLEDEISSLANIHELKSRSEANFSVITVELEMTVPQDEIPQRWEFLRRKIELAMPKLPKGVQTPMVVDDIGDVYGMFYALSADEGFSYDEMADYADYLQRNILEVEGVSKIQVYGKQRKELIIKISSDMMSQLGVLPMQMYAAIEDHLKVHYSGSIQTGNQLIRATITNSSQELNDIRNIMLRAIDGSMFKLGDVADISLDYNVPLRNTLFLNNQKAVGIGISMEHGENIIEVGARVEEKIRELSYHMPVGYTLEKVFFQPEKVQRSIQGFMWNLILSVVIVIVVLMFTMGFRGGIIIGSGLILTILATFPILFLCDGTLQRISLGAFIVAMGMLVDNAIVVLDGILIQRSKGGRGKSAYTKTAKQTTIPLLGATLIAITAFFPVYLSPDTAGTYVRDLFLVLAISLALSWIFALTQVPMFSAIAFRNQKIKSKKEEGDIYNRPLYRFNRIALEWAMRHRILVIIFSIALLFLSIFNMSKVDQTFFPDFDYDQCYIEYTLPYGSSPEMVQNDLREITDYLNGFDDVKMVVSSHGMTPLRYCLVRGMMTENADHYGELIVNFTDYQSMQSMRPIIYKYLRENYPESITRIRKYTLSVKSTHAVEAEFKGPDPAVLKNLSTEVQGMMLRNENIDRYTICDDWELSNRMVRIDYDENAAQRSNISRSDVSNAILAATDGLPITNYWQGETRRTVRMKVCDIDGNQIQNIDDIPVWGTLPSIKEEANMSTIMGIANGAVNIDDIIQSTMSAVVMSSVSKTPSVDFEEAVVRRSNGKRVIQAQCDPKDGVSAALIQSELDELIQEMDIPDGYEFRWVGESELKTQGLENILSYLPLAAGIILLILMFLFNDYRRPLIIILCLPMSIIGIVHGLLIFNQPFSFIAIVGVIGLTGMIIKNAIVLLDEIDLRIKTNQSAYSAVVDATISRVRPVMMASLTTILGMVPLIADPMYGSLAAAIISGLIVGTMITLIFVPILYTLFYNITLQ